MTILETAVYLSVLGVVGLPIMFMTINSTRATAEADAISRTVERNRVALQRVSSEFRCSISGTQSIGSLGKILTFTLSAGFAGSGPTAGDIISYSIQDDPDDPLNGVDDDGDGLTDEVILVRTHQPSGEQLTIATNLDYFGSGFVQSGDAVTITITTIGITSHRSPLPVKVSQTVRLFARN